MIDHLVVTVLWNGLISLERDFTQIHYIDLESTIFPDECRELHVVVKGSYEEIAIPTKFERFQLIGSMADVYKWLRMTSVEKVDLFTPTKIEIVDFNCIDKLSCKAHCKALNIRPGDIVDIFDENDLQYVTDDGAHYIVLSTGSEFGKYTTPIDANITYYIWDIGKPGSVLAAFCNSTQVKLVSSRPVIGTKDFPHTTRITNLTITASRIKHLRTILKRCPNLTTLTIRGTTQRFYKRLRNNKTLTSINLPYEDPRINEIIRRNLVLAYEENRVKIF